MGGFLGWKIKQDLEDEMNEHSVFYTIECQIEKLFD